MVLENEVDPVPESPWNVLEYDLLVLENFDWIMEGYSFEIFPMLLWIPVTLCVFLDYLRRIKVDCFVNLAACKLVVYLFVFWYVLLAESLKTSLKSFHFKVTEEMVCCVCDLDVCHSWQIPFISSCSRVCQRIFMVSAQVCFTILSVMFVLSAYLPVMFGKMSLVKYQKYHLS